MDNDKILVMKRSCGTLMPVFSLPSVYGIGALNTYAYSFIDFLEETGQKYWQVLPLSPTGYGNSPYQSCCDSAGNQYYIDLDELVVNGLLNENDVNAFKTEMTSFIDYGSLFSTRFILLRKAFENYKTDTDFNDFIDKGKYYNYALYMAIKQSYDYAPWYDWDNKLKYRDKKTIQKFCNEHYKDILFWQWCQYIFFKQWSKLKDYALKKNIKIIGDLPIYCAYDSVDCYFNPELFDFNDKLEPNNVAGVPPDYFSSDGQLWGNPLYSWDIHKKQGYKYWLERIENGLEMYDIIRLDHFRGFDRYYSVPYGQTDAKNGVWKDGPKEDLFYRLKNKFKGMPFIAEDLGNLDNSFMEFFKKVELPGMKVLQFAFEEDADNPHLPHNVIEDCVYYTGTHDNPTLKEYLGNMDVEKVKRCLKALKISGVISLSTDDLCLKFIEKILNSKSYLTIIPLWDWLILDKDYRINTPSVMNSRNWSARFDFCHLNTDNIKKLLGKSLRL